ncbi:unnamed protein product [Peronospora belbahrii]|uniref:Uncharacterized protein n=1 Tax=Peronospora belbahrii TaxID=622444 RepID=A0AAU9KHT3_9STRA|nr:unnamed protein product [Peronospora belbahrii]
MENDYVNAMKSDDVLFDLSLIVSCGVCRLTWTSVDAPETAILNGTRHSTDCATTGSGSESVYDVNDDEMRCVYCDHDCGSCCDYVVAGSDSDLLRLAPLVKVEISKMMDGLIWLVSFEGNRFLEYYWKK